jgi:proteasome lid subunit RPN8/RPN11
MSDADANIPPPLKIKVKPIRQKTSRGRLPARVDDYPKKLPAVFLSEETLDSLRRFARSEVEQELGGVLIGRTGRTSRRKFVEIRGFIPAEKGVSKRASFAFTNEAQEAIHNILEQKYPDEQVVGWFHTHPGYGIFLSAADQFLDRNYFSEPYHIAIVLDPCAPEVEVGTFVWDRHRQRIRVPLFLVS